MATAVHKEQPKGSVESMPCPQICHQSVGLLTRPAADPTGKFPLYHAAAVGKHNW